MKPKVIDLFAGVGGLSLGFEMQGFDVVLANEYDESIASAYSANHKNTKMIVGDITSLDLTSTFGPYTGQIDVVIGGPPCQGFSQKGQRKTIHDERNFLFQKGASYEQHGLLLRTQYPWRLDCLRTQRCQAVL